MATEPMPEVPRMPVGPFVMAPPSAAESRVAAIYAARSPRTIVSTSTEDCSINRRLKST
jgi:hypothetical protein